MLLFIRNLILKMRIYNVKSIFPADTNGLNQFENFVKDLAHMAVNLRMVEAEIRVKTGNLMDIFYIKLPVYYFRIPLLSYKRY